MKSIVNLLIISFLLILTGKTIPVSGQVVIPDANLRQFIILTYPSVMLNATTLDTIASATIGGAFDADNQDISDAEGIQYFKGLDILRMRSNNLTTLPDLTRLSNLMELRIDTNQISTLPSLDALTNLQVLTVRENQLTQLPSLTNNTLLRILFCDNNQLTSLPSLATLTDLQLLICSDNPLGSLPDFSNLTSLNRVLAINCTLSTLPDLSNCSSLKDVIVSGNQLTVFPDLTGLPIEDLDFAYNQLQSLPDLSVFPGLTYIKFNNNRFSFDALIPSSDHPAFTTFTFSPQYPGIGGTLNTVEKNSLEINLGFDDTLTTSSYSWYKNGVFIGTTSQNKWIIPSVSMADSGTYTCEITNNRPAFSSITLYSQPFKVVVMPCISAANIIVNTQANCTYPIELQVNESSIIGGTLPFNYTLANQEDTLDFTSSMLYVPKEGSYDLTITDAAGCEVVLKNEIHLERNENCDPVFYPNGDGIADTYHIEQKGTARIYGRDGSMIKELQTPAHWDGTTLTGAEAPTGLYVIVLNKTTTIKVSLIR